MSGARSATRYMRAYLARGALLQRRARGRQARWAQCRRRDRDPDRIHRDQGRLRSIARSRPRAAIPTAMSMSRASRRISPSTSQQRLDRGRGRGRAGDRQFLRRCRAEDARALSPAGTLRRSMAPRCFAAALAGARAAPDRPGRTTAVDLDLVLAVDVSGSVNQARFELQKQGYAAAFRNPRVLDAIAAARTVRSPSRWCNGPARPSMSWWSTGPWCATSASADALADAIAAVPRELFGGGTSLSGAIDYSHGAAGRRAPIAASGGSSTSPATAPTIAAGPAETGARRGGEAGRGHQRPADPGTRARSRHLLS